MAVIFSSFLLQLEWWYLGILTGWCMWVAMSVRWSTKWQESWFLQNMSHKNVIFNLYVLWGAEEMQGLKERVTVEGTWDPCALRWPHRAAAEVGAALISARPTLAPLTQLRLHDSLQWSLRLCRRCHPPPSAFSILSHPVLSGQMPRQFTAEPAGTSLYQLLTLSSPVNKRSSSPAHAPLLPRLGLF